MRKNRRIKRRGYAMAALLVSASFLLALPARSGENVETRKNKKGQVDRWVYRRDGMIYRRDYDRNGDGNPDFRVIEDHGRLVRKEYDRNYDGKFDRVEKSLAQGSSGRIKTIDTENAIPT